MTASGHPVKGLPKVIAARDSLRVTLGAVRFDLFSSGRLYQALKDADYPDLPTERTVRRWIKDNAPPALAVTFVQQLLEADTTKKAPRPEWAKGLGRKIDAIALTVGVDAELLAEIEAAHRDAGELEHEPRPPAEAHRPSGERPRDEPGAMPR